MALITRTSKGKKLTIQEMDGNLIYLDSKGSTPTDITYADLYTAIVSSSLTPGQKYRVTDYKSVNFLNGWDLARINPTSTDPNFDPREIHTGDNEVIIVEAISTYELSPIAFSETFSGDIIEFQPYTNKIGVDIGGIYNGQTLNTGNIIDIGYPYTLNFSGTPSAGDDDFDIFPLGGSGTGIGFNIEKTGGIYNFVAVKPSAPGTGYQVGDVFIILGSQLGGVNGVNDLTIEILTITTQNETITVSGFDLQWDGTNVYFNMPAGYPALFGHYFYLYAEFNDGVDDYYQDGCFEPLTPVVSVCQYPYTSNDPDNTYLKDMSRLKVVNNGTKVILLDLTQADVNNYIADSLYVDTVYALGNAYGWITKRVDTERNITTPLDFRGRTYRRFKVDLSDLNPAIGMKDYYGQGDNYLGRGTTGDFKDFKVLSNDIYECYNLEWIDFGGPNKYWYTGYNDNVVFTSRVTETNISSYCTNNTLIDSQHNNLGSYFYDNSIEYDFTFNNILNEFRGNLISNSFRNNIINQPFQNNKTGRAFWVNQINGNFTNNTIGDNMEKNIFNEIFNSCIITSSQFRLNTINIAVSGANFTSATHVYGTYNCEIIRGSNNVNYLTYYNGTAIQYTTVTA